MRTAPPPHSESTPAPGEFSGGAAMLAELVRLLTTLEATLRGVRLGDPQQLVSDSDRS